MSENVKKGRIVTTDLRGAAATAASTVATGVSTTFAWIPDDIGKLASLVGLVLSSILIIYYIKLIRKIDEKRKD